MIYELRTYTIKHGSVQEVAKNSGTVARSIRGDNYGKLEGYWISEIGPINQVIHLWSYSDLNERQRLRAELAKNARWTGEYLPLVRPNLVRQDIRLMNQVIGPTPPARDGNVYELRTYRAKPGGIKQWLEHFTAVLPTREKYSKIVGLWSGEAGQPNEVVHIWAYPDLNTRQEARAAASKDPRFQQFIKDSSHLLDELHACIMLPAAHSPMK